MINKLYGKIEEIMQDKIILNVHDIYYEIYVPNPYFYKKGEYFLIDTYLSFKFDRNEMELYGFSNLIEKRLFTDLLKVQGIGPKSAIVILAKESAEMIYFHIKNKNESFLAQLPRIGSSTAKKIIMELSNKIKNDMFKISFENENIKLSYDALKSLGYKETEIKIALEKVDNTLDASDIIKCAIKVIGNGK